MADEGPIQLRVGASVDTSLAAATASTIAAMKRARQVAQSESEAAAAAQGKAADKAAKAAQKAYEQTITAAEKASRKEQAAADKAASAKGRAEIKAFDAKLKASQRAADAYERDLLREVAAAEKASARKAAIAEREARQAAKSAGADRFGFARGAAGTFGRIAGAAGRLGMGIAKGAGVNLDIGSAVQESLASQAKAAALSRMGFQEGQAGVAGTKQEAGAIHADAAFAANQIGRSVGDTTDAMTAFVKKSGDLEAARASITDLGMLANSTGADFNKLAGDAGVLSLKLDSAFGADKVGKAKAIQDVLRGLAAQGKLGAIDITDLAAQLPKMLAAASQFGGDRGQMIANIGFLAQMSAKSGGSGSAAQAATSVAQLPQALRKGKTAAAWKAAGIDIYTDKSQTLLNDPVKLVEAAIYRTKGNAAAMSKLFAGSSVSRAAEGMRQTYVRAGGGAAGMAAMKKEFDDLGGATLSAGQVQKDNAERMAETGAKVQLFNNKIEEVGGKLAETLLPAFEKLEPVILRAADALVKVVDFAVGNPGEAMAIAVAASIAKAGIGDVIKNLLTGGGTGGGGGGGGAGALLGGAVLGATIGHAVVAGAAGDNDKIISSAGAVQDQVQDILAQARAARKAGGLSKEGEVAIQQQASVVTGITTEKRDTERSQGVMGNLNFIRGDLSAETHASHVNAGEGVGALQASQDAQLAALKALHAALTGGIKVTNMPAGGGGLAPGRADAGDPNN